MAQEINAGLLSNKWVHSHEEDSGSEMVFRPSTYHFPVSRGRASFELSPDGSLSQSGIAPDDRSARSTGTWKLKGKNSLAFYDGEQKPATSVMQIASVAPDKLVVKK